MPAHESSDVLSDDLENNSCSVMEKMRCHSNRGVSGRIWLSTQRWHRPYYFSTDIKHVNIPIALTFIKVSQQIFFLQKIFQEEKHFCPVSQLILSISLHGQGI